MPDDKPAIIPGTDHGTTEYGAGESAFPDTAPTGDDEGTTVEPNDEAQIDALEHHASAGPALDDDAHTDDDIGGPAQSADAFAARHDADGDPDTPVFQATNGDPDVDAFISAEIRAGTMNVVRARNFRDAAGTASQPATGIEAVRSWDQYLAENDPDYERSSFLDDDTDDE